MQPKLKSNAFDFLAHQEKKELISRDIKVGVIDEDKVNSEIYNDDAEALQKLINDIESVGLSAPLTVRRNKEYTDRYILVSGHRRLKALKALGYTIVPCMVVKTDNEEDELKADIMHLTSNIMTRERSLMERSNEARLLKERIKALKEVNPEGYKGKTDDIVAKMLNVSSSYVRQLVRLNNADEDIKELVSKELIGISEALKLQGMDEDDKGHMTEKIRNAENDDEVKRVKQEELSKVQASTGRNEKSVDDVIEADFKKIEKIVKRISVNISKSRMKYKNEIEAITSELKEMV